MRGSASSFVRIECDRRLRPSREIRGMTSVCLGCKTLPPRHRARFHAQTCEVKRKPPGTEKQDVQGLGQVHQPDVNIWFGSRGMYVYILERV